MNPERWHQVREVYEHAVAVASTERESYLEQACAKDDELRHEVESLLQYEVSAGSEFLRRPAVDLLQATAELGRSRIGTRLGVYQILEQIGRGGMGEVYRSCRVDGEYEKEVAVKLVRGGFDSAAVLQRFRQERQILAALDHPNIARLLDGGTTEDGVPYLVMELVKGTPIDRYCIEHELSVEERLQLFSQVCSAVQYAHQHLVIHRDLKPGNILVTPEGIPKLLDFGIAKLFDPSARPETTLVSALTPEYASPEQIRGEPVTTASDVYSLGVVLYRLLTGRLPYRIATQNPAELARVISEVEAQLPSDAIAQPRVATERKSESSVPGVELVKLQRRLKGDLDYIVLKALRKEPERRYASLEQFAADIRCDLQHLPVTATPDSLSYRLRKFVRRHRAGVAATALLVLAVAGGIVATVREARIADSNRRRAESRFNDVRKLANSLIFEVNDSIENIPGTTQPRKLILQRALEYLDRLAKESGNDSDLQRELAAGYLRIANLQGSPADSNLGDTTAALASFRKGLALRESLARLNSGSRKDQVELADAYIDYSYVQSDALGNPRVSLEYIEKALAILDRERTAAPDDLQILGESVKAYTKLGMLQTGDGMIGTVGTVSAGADALQKALVLHQHAIQLFPMDIAARRREADISLSLGDARVKLGDRQAALDFYRHAVAIYESLNANGNDLRAANNGAIVKERIAEVILMEGKTSEAIVFFTEHERDARQLATRDPHSQILQQNLIAASALLGHALVEGGRAEQGAKYIREVLERLDARRSETPLIRTFQAQAHAWLGEAAERSGRVHEAFQEYAKGKAILAATRAAGANDLRMQVYFSVATDRIAAVYLKLGYVARARKEYDESLALLEPLAQANPDNMEVLYALSETYTGQGNVAMKLAETVGNDKANSWMAARNWFQKSQTIWNRVPNPARISTSYLEVTLPAEVSRRLAVCSTELTSLNDSVVPH